ncbi:MAG: PaaX family transcriptional regulator C-terminal domain-containing protein [Congregibacter sp.]
MLNPLASDPQIHTPTPKRLMLSLLSARDNDTMSLRQCIAWGDLFSIDAAAMRVALGRMVKTKLLVSVHRGVYRIGPEAHVLSDAARSWVRAEERIGPWDGDWLLVHTAHLGRRDKRCLRLRERALRLDGFVAMEGGLWVRPANYVESPEETRARLILLGLDPDAYLLRSNTMLGPELPPTDLWPRAELESSYVTLEQRMQKSLNELPRLTVREAARETFLLGEYVIRQINSDPLLPDVMVDGGARRRVHRQMRRYDEAGFDAWKRFQADADLEFDNRN